MAVVVQEPIIPGIVELRIQATSQAYTFSYAIDNRPPHHLISCSTRYLSSEVAGGFTGVYLAMYATGNGQAATIPADFDWFDYELM